MRLFRSLFGFVLKKIGNRSCRPHCICGYGVPTLKGLVGGGWGRRLWELAGARGRGEFFLHGRKEHKTR